jgi:AcrR family transcriptional regulator
MIQGMPEGVPTRLAGRAAEAARNDERIVESARAVFLDEPKAPITAVAKHAGVGISALYSRYGSKEELIEKISRDAMETFLAEIDRAMKDDRDPWTAFADFMRRVVDADLSSLTIKLAGTFDPSEELAELATRLNRELSDRLFPRFKKLLRPGVKAHDLSLVLEMVAAVKMLDRARTEELRRRYLAMILDGMRADRTERLPGPPPSWQEVAERWKPADWDD